MNILIVDDDAAQRAIVSKRIAVEWPEARIFEASHAREARIIAGTHQIDVLSIELAIPERAGESAVPGEERLTLDHRIVSAKFPGLALVRELVGSIPSLRLRVYTLLRLDHPDVLAAQELGAESITRKPVPFEIPIRYDSPAKIRPIDREGHTGRTQGP